MRVALIAPPFSGRSRGLPLGLAYLAAVLENDDIIVKTIDMTVDTLTSEELAFLLNDFSPNVVGISASSATYLNAVDVAQTCRDSLGPSVTIVMGGPHVQCAAATVLTLHEAVDICVIGEAEETFRQLIRVLARNPHELSTVPGLALRDSTQVYFSPPRTLLPNLDSLPFPARHQFHLDKYPDAVGVFEVGSPSKAELIAARGCPGQCSFCSTKEFWRNTYRPRSPFNVVQELGVLSRMGMTDVYFDDDTFTIQRNWVLQFCEQLRASDFSFRWACGTRVDAIDTDLIRNMKASGCTYIYFGVETKNPGLLSHQRKGTTLHQIESSFELLKEFGIYSCAALIFGLPGETWDTAAQTIDWVRNVLQPDEVWISKACCYPGTLLASHYAITSQDYESRTDGRALNGLVYGTAGIYTPFFLNTSLVAQIWEYIHENLGHLNLGFADE